jgi:hypothetical protein
VDRRVFLRECVMGTGVAACTFGGLWYRCRRSRGRIVEQLVDSARPVLDQHALSEQEQYPGAAGEKIRAYFDGICLNSAEFVAEISTPEFRRKLNKIRAADRRHQELLAVFCRRVEGAGQIGAKVHAVLADIGPKLDQHWNTCCTEIALRWEAPLFAETQPRFSAEEFRKRVTPLLERQVESAARQARRVTDEPGWREAVRSLGTEALETTQEISLNIGGQSVKMPEFAVTAWRQAFKTVLDLLGDTKWDCQKTMTERLASLGLKTAAEFEKELRRRLNDLHFWREQAVRLAAEQHAAERIGFFGEHS